jgi:hypothetical protein
MSTAEQKPPENPELIETAELPVLQEGGSEGAVAAAEEPEEVTAAPEGESLIDSLKRKPLSTNIDRYRDRDVLASDGSEVPSSREIRARREAAEKQQAEAEARQAIEEATTPEKNEPEEAAIPVNKGMPRLPEMPRSSKAAEKPAETVTEPEAAATPEAQPEPLQPENPAPRRSRAARRGSVSAVPQAPAETPAPEAAQPATTSEEEPIPLNTATASDVKDVLASTYAAQERQLPKSPLERPNVDGEDAASISQRPSYGVQFNTPATVSPRVQAAQTPATPEATPEPEGGLNSHLSPDVLARLASFGNSLSEDTSVPEATPGPATEPEVVPAPESEPSYVYSPDQANAAIARSQALIAEFKAEFPHLAGEAEVTHTPDAETAEPAATPEPEAEPGRRRRHARETPAGLSERLLGFTSSRTPDNETTAETTNETTQPIPTVSSEGAEPAPDSGATGETRPLTRRQRLRAKLGSIATAIGDFVDTDRRNEPLSPEEITERQRISGARRAKIVTGLGLAAAAAGLVSTINAETANESRPRAPISANQLPGQQQETNESSLADRAKEALADAQERLREAGEKPSTPQTPEESDKTVRTDHENITVSNDGSVTVELRQGGNYWEGIHEAEQMLDIDDSAAATANAVNTIGFEEGEDRNQKVGSKITFKNVNGKLVAVRS